MCGRFTLHHSAEEINNRFEITTPLFTPQARYNIAPSQTISVVMVTTAAERVLAQSRWGLIPSWAQDQTVATNLFNARAETVAEKPAFRQAFQRRRCLIPADGFYEWQKTGKTKLPVYIRLRSQQLFAFAGLWDEWQDPQGQVIHSCTIITVEPNSLIAGVHHRMAAILPSAVESIWLNAQTSPADLIALLRPYPADLMEMYPVAPRVNSTSVEGPDCITPTTTPTTIQLSLLE
jgi:putative SOS response-associated peptidase YedK